MIQLPALTIALTLTPMTAFAANVTNNTVIYDEATGEITLDLGKSYTE